MVAKMEKKKKRRLIRNVLIAVAVLYLNRCDPYEGYDTSIEEDAVFFSFVLSAMLFLALSRQGFIKTNDSNRDIPSRLKRLFVIVTLVLPAYFFFFKPLSRFTILFLNSDRQAMEIPTGRISATSVYASSSKDHKPNLTWITLHGEAFELKVSNAYADYLNSTDSLKGLKYGRLNYLYIHHMPEE